MDQLKVLHQNGEFSSAFEVSTDRVNWTSARSVIAKLRRVPLKAKKLDREGGRDADKKSTLGHKAKGIAGNKGWYYSVNGQTPTCVTWDTVKKLVQSRSLSPQDYLLQEGTREWVPVSQYDELLELIQVDDSWGSWGTAMAGIAGIFVSLAVMSMLADRLGRTSFIPSEHLIVFFAGMLALFCAALALLVGHSTTQRLAWTTIPASTYWLIVVGFTGGFTTLLTQATLLVMVVLRR